MPRPQIYTNEQMIAALADRKGLVYLAAKKLGCDPGTIYRRAQKSPTVANAIKNQRGEIIDLAEMRLFEAIDKGAPWAVSMLLKTLGKERGYVEKLELVPSPADEEPEAPVREIVVSTREEATALLPLLAEAGGIPERD